MYYKQVKNILRRAGYNVREKFEIFDNGECYDVYTNDYFNNLVLIVFTKSIKMKKIMYLY